MIKLDYKAVPKPIVFADVKFLRMPLERIVVLYNLEQDQYYSAAEVARSAYSVGSKDYEAARKAYGTHSRRHKIGTSFDNIDRDDSETPRWEGSSWTSTLNNDHLCGLYKLMERLKSLQEKDAGPYILVSDDIWLERDWLARRAKKTKSPYQRRARSESKNAPQTSSDHPVTTTALAVLSPEDGETRKSRSQSGRAYLIADPLENESIRSIADEFSKNGTTNTLVAVKQVHQILVTSEASEEQFNSDSNNPRGAFYFNSWSKRAGFLFLSFLITVTAIFFERTCTDNYCEVCENRTMLAMRPTELSTE